MSSEYTTSPVLYREYTRCPASVYVFCPCPVSTLSALPLPSNYTISHTSYPVTISSLLPMSHHCIIPPVHACPISTPYPSMSTQHIIPSVHVQSLHHISCPCLVSTIEYLSLHVQRVHHIFFLCPVSTPYLLLTSIQYTIFPAHVQ